MQFNKTLMTAALLTVGGFAAISANAAEPNPAKSAFDVNLKVNSVCTVKSASDIDLGEIQAGLATADVTKTATLTLNCSQGAVPVVSLTPSSDTIDGIGAMTGETSEQTVPYKLTSVSANGAAWGNGVNAFSLPVATQYSNDINTTIYATVTDTADVKPDNYSDTINVSVAY